jgi:hypothetical protein
LFFVFVHVHFIIKKIVVSLKEDWSLWDSLHCLAHVVPRSRVYGALTLISLYAFMVQFIGVRAALQILTLYHVSYAYQTFELNLCLRVFENDVGNHTAM